MKNRCVRYNKTQHVERGIIHANTVGFKDIESPKALTELINALHSSYKRGNAEGDLIDAKWCPQVGDEYYTFEEPIALAILKCVKTISQQVQNAYNKGKEDGKNILVQLNNGDLSMSDFNK